MSTRFPAAVAARIALFALSTTVVASSAQAAQSDLGASDIVETVPVAGSSDLAADSSSAQGAEDSIARSLQVARITQSGDGNLARIDQSGSLNVATIVQSGNGNSAWIVQSGRGNVAYIAQSSR